MMGVGTHRDVIKTVHYYKDLKMGNSITSLEKKLKTHLYCHIKLPLLTRGIK